MRPKGGRLRRYLLVALLALGCALALASTALATSYAYAGPGASFTAGRGYSSSYASGWRKTEMTTAASVQGTVVFIDAQSYGWHNTVTSISTYRSTTWTPNGVSRKAYCLETKYMFNGGTQGACWVNTST
jgi:hypothetical protein